MRSDSIGCKLLGNGGVEFSKTCLGTLRGDALLSPDPDTEQAVHVIRIAVPDSSLAVLNEGDFVTAYQGVVPGVPEVRVVFTNGDDGALDPRVPNDEAIARDLYCSEPSCRSCS